MCLRIRSAGVTLFAAITIWSALSTGVTPVGWPVRIPATQAAPVTATVECRRAFQALQLLARQDTATVERRRAFRAMQLQVRQDISPESRQDTQLPAMQHL